jgi:hypothetical protein
MYVILCATLTVKGKIFFSYGWTTEFWQKDNGTLTANTATFPTSVSIVLNVLILCKHFVLYVECKVDECT